MDVADRGGNIYQAMRTARGLVHHFFFRLCRDRLISVINPSEDKRRARLHCIRHLLDLISYEKVPRKKQKLSERFVREKF